jgi:hypothetical protein
MIAERAESPSPILRERAQILRDIGAASNCTDETLDPLNKNGFFEDLPRLIKMNRYGEICYQIREMAGTVNTMNLLSLSLPEQKAVQRDLTFAIAAGVGFLIPIADVGIFPGAEEAVFKVPALIGGSPRNNDETNSETNRRFTEVKTDIEVPEEDGQMVTKSIFAEIAFKISVKAALSNQTETIETLMKATAIPLTDPAFPKNFGEIAENHARFVAAMTVARKDLPPGSFCDLARNFNQQRIRRPHEVIGRVYIHSGSQITMPLFLDNALGIVTAQDRVNGTAYSDYLTENLAKATIPHQVDFKNMLDNLQGKPLIHRLLGALADDRIKGRDRQVLIESAHSILAVLTSIYQARWVHHSALIAQEESAQANNNGEVRISTGGRRDIVYPLLQKTSHNRNTLNVALKRLTFYPSLQ